MPVKKLKAVVVEDEAAWRSAIAKALISLGFDVLELTNAPAAIDYLLQVDDIHLLMLDWDLRDSSEILPTAIGADVLEAVARKRPHLTVVILTGATHSADYKSWLELRGDDPDDEVFNMLKWTPHVLSKKRFQAELANGLPSLAAKLRALNLAKSIHSRTSPPLPTCPPPYTIHIDTRLNPAGVSFHSRKNRNATVTVIDESDRMLLHALCEFSRNGLLLNHSVVLKCCPKARGFKPDSDEAKAQRAIDDMKRRLKSAGLIPQTIIRKRKGVWEFAPDIKIRGLGELPATHIGSDIERFSDDSLD